MHIRSTHPLALALAASGLLAACGGSDSPSAAAAPRMQLSISATEDFAGSYGSVGAYEKVTGVLRYDAPNRGNILTLPNPTATPGDAVYHERGYELLYSAWQGDVPKSTPARLTVTVPVARNRDGSSITGSYRTELVPAAAVPSMALPGGVFNGSMIPYEPASLDNTQAGYSLTRRINETDARQPVPAGDWKFASCDAAANPFPGTASATSVCLKGGFDPQYHYEIVYVATVP
jgi:hypothetical protein